MKGVRALYSWFIGYIEAHHSLLGNRRLSLFGVEFQNMPVSGLRKNVRFFLKPSYFTTFYLTYLLYYF